ncbi:NTP transferase domain-containing protein [Deinococcus cellulosilyticus]|uniref:MobA-like NTP transferase domain-containing protein n=1 Tax=Deinococcus cellulosilyticus (strain DSM 18568 / NBRC 106333 / KACC 11606 / 5516J-15) TaxID=1223518 RepID=A0A511NA86_DEIC1|nr:NTP transferase domain-containing protein [Deinococcus cellulosilyticus]GEM49744.1 hypothetical protein DC3_53790 [Deinococcus cellulosilyticus NBRC 106333 = KACC 11606]
MTHWNALVLGGGDPSDPFATAHQAPVKPLIDIHGKAMSVYVLEALRDSGRIAHIAYIGPTTPAVDALIQQTLPDQGSLIGNLEYGVQQMPAGNRVLVVTADIPMMTATELREVLDSAPDSGLVYPIVRKEDCEKAYPGVKRTYAKLKDGVFTGGNIFILKPEIISTFLPRLKEMLANRKNPLKLAGLIGFGTLVRLLTGQLSLKRLEQKVGSILGVSVSAMPTRYASIGTDVDKDADLDLARSKLA